MFVFSGSAKSNRVGFSTIPGSPQDPHEMLSQRKAEPIYSLSTNPSSDAIDNRPNMPTIEEQENTVNSEDEDEQPPTPVDNDAETECNLNKKSNMYRCTFLLCCFTFYNKKDTHTRLVTSKFIASLLEHCKVDLNHSGLHKNSKVKRYMFMNFFPQILFLFF